MLDKWTERKALCSGLGTRKGLEMIPTKEISCWFMCFIRPSRQRTSLALHFSLVRLLICSNPTESRFSLADALFSRVFPPVGQGIAWLASKFHGNNAFEDSMAEAVSIEKPTDESSKNGPASLKASFSPFSIGPQRREERQ